MFREGWPWRALFDLDGLDQPESGRCGIVWWLAITLVGMAGVAAAVRGFSPRWRIEPSGGAYHAGPESRGPRCGRSQCCNAWSRSGWRRSSSRCGAGVVVAWRGAGAGLYVRANARHLLLMEALALALFLAFSVCGWATRTCAERLGGEKPMDLAYFNGRAAQHVSRRSIPGFRRLINYYYFGYVLVARRSS
jgi:hypothetical protein